MQTMTSANNDPNKYGSSSRTEEVSDNVAALRKDISKLAESVKSLAAEQFGTSAAEIQDKALDKIGDLESAIRKNPSQSALIAAGIGLFVGLILVR